MCQEMEGADWAEKHGVKEPEQQRKYENAKQTSQSCLVPQNW